MAEGDTLARIAAGLRPHLVGRTVTPRGALRGPSRRFRASSARRSTRSRRSARTCSSASTTGSSCRDTFRPATVPGTATGPARRGVDRPVLCAAPSSRFGAPWRVSTRCPGRRALRARAEAVTPRSVRRSDLLAPEFDAGEAVASAAPRARRDRDRRGGARPARAGRDRQRLQERGPVHRAGRPVRADATSTTRPSTASSRAPGGSCTTTCCDPRPRRGGRPRSTGRLAPL